MDFIVPAKKLRRSKDDGCVYGYTRKPYIRRTPYPKGTVHIKPLKRENAAYIKLTKLGYSINQLSEAFGRSTRYIHKIVRNEVKIGYLRLIDKRKLPHAIRMRTSSIRRKMLRNYLKLWENWILGEGEKPP